MSRQRVVHEVKSWTGLFQPIYDGVKTHDLRVMDRDYQVGDILRLKEWDALERSYTGREVEVEITHITAANRQHCAFSPIGLHPAMGILSIKRSPA